MNQDIYLSMDRNGAVPRMEAVQGDTGRSVLCRFADFSLVSGDTAACWFERPNGTRFTQSGIVDATEQTVTVNLVENGPLTQAGRVKAQLEITRSGSIVSSFVFEIYVEEKISGAATQEDLTWRDEVIAEIGDKMIYDSGAGYIRYTDGHMICYGSIEVPAQTEMVQVGQLYRAEVALTHYFAKSFISDPIVSSSTKNGWLQITCSVTHNQYLIGNIRFLNTSNTAAAFYLEYVAVGKWR